MGSSLYLVPLWPEDNLDFQSRAANGEHDGLLNPRHLIPNQPIEALTTWAAVRPSVTGPKAAMVRRILQNPRIAWPKSFPRLMSVEKMRQKTMERLWG